ncbi:cysteine desulfurase [Niabella sp. CC-SYL272]|uniref:family 2A encapsulin nanocompartment cargo protein cysteine desulfurase n=1 Tax=Niabella agricola TaxID=2891571 RepID=UPI001F2C36E8|nr:family 2A encapsulin nanocompartment cargo protein cysteine desulfurase [Niabella agricola]MCF3110935.1 cysteine desulfurase [Niabella agricola]
MSINIDEQTGLPDLDQLQQLANAFFRALPGDAQPSASLNPEDHPNATAIAGKMTGGLPDLTVARHDTLAGQSGMAPQQTPVVPQHPFSGLQTPPSAGGLGASSSVISYVPLKDLPKAEEDRSGPQHTSTHGGRIPASVAGSGASPSHLEQGQHFDIRDPETGFPDANLTGGSQPVKSATISPLETEQPYWADVEALLKHITIPSFAPQLPGFDAAVPSYYFGTAPQVNSTSLKQQAGLSSFNAHLYKKDFPILNETVNGKPLVWFDNAATTQKPKAVMDRITWFYEHENSNIHRAAHELAARATDAYEAAREKVRVFLGARSANEIIFVRGATEAINLVAQSWGEQYLQSGDEIVVSHLEHHANIVPWKRLADKKGLKLRVIPVDDDGQILLDEYARLLNAHTKLVAFTQVSNALGTVTPAQQMVAMAHAVGAKVLVDGAQSVSHMTVNMQVLDADWFVFSGHKVFGPTGIGVVYGKEGLLNATQPWQGGGNMIQDVTFEEIRYHNAPARFEAGTGNIADAVGLGAALDYISRIGMENIGQYEHFLLEYATGLIKQIPGVRRIGTAAHKASVLSFTMDGYSNDEVGKALNEEGIEVRTGHHCAQPILRRMGVESTVRPSLAFYNTCEDVDRFIEVLWRLRKKK